ncbi:hypothetical protein C8F01DRAFT_1370497 [Mycena amicta]|nr:hypothetical protein C8F01DRAFT_1370497 [Mycena amicta]
MRFFSLITAALATATVANALHIGAERRASVDVRAEQVTALEARRGMENLLSARVAGEDTKALEARAGSPPDLITILKGLVTELQSVENSLPYEPPFLQLAIKLLNQVVVTATAANSTKVNFPSTRGPAEEALEARAGTPPNPVAILNGIISELQSIESSLPFEPTLLQIVIEVLQQIVATLGKVNLPSARGPAEEALEARATTPSNPIAILNGIISELQNIESSLPFEPTVLQAAIKVLQQIVATLGKVNPPSARGPVEEALDARAGTPSNPIAILNGIITELKSLETSLPFEPTLLQIVIQVLEQIVATLGKVNLPSARGPAEEALAARATTPSDPITLLKGIISELQNIESSLPFEPTVFQAAIKVLQQVVAILTAANNSTGSTGTKAN